MIQSDDGDLAVSPKSRRFTRELRDRPYPFVIAALLLCGCGGGNELGRHAISGTVTFQGQPLDHGLIEFSPAAMADGVQSGSAIADGKYEIIEDYGLPPGKYKVVISSAGPGSAPRPIDSPGDAPPPSPERIPAKYNAKSELIIDVTPESDGVFNFDLK
jgi:hypothetical protein